MLSWKITAIFGVILLVMAGLGAWYFNYSQNKIADLNTRMGSYETAIQTQQGTINVMKKSIEDSNAAQAQLSQQFSNVQANTTAALQKVLSKHNISADAAAHPKLIETDINNGTKKAASDFENITDPSNFAPAAQGAKK